LRVQRTRSTGMRRKEQDNKVAGLGRKKNNFGGTYGGGKGGKTNRRGRIGGEEAKEEDFDK